MTHGIHWLPMVDRIIVMRDGSIQEIGSYSELINVGGAFAEFIETYLQECVDEENEDPESKNAIIIIIIIIIITIIALF